jgi:hypothetical protein
MKDMNRMVIEIEKKYHKGKVDKELRQLKSRKLFDAKHFAGRISWKEDPLAYQKRVRDEWD